jgi:hypothetical protein
MSDLPGLLPGQPTAVFIRSNEEGQVVIIDPTQQWELFVMSPEQAEVLAENLRSKAEEARRRTTKNWTNNSRSSSIKK